MNEDPRQKMSDWLLCLTGFILLLTGCETYDKSRYTPDSFNYTYATDRNLKPDGHWFGLSWTLKRTP